MTKRIKGHVPLDPDGVLVIDESTKYNRTCIDNNSQRCGINLSIYNVMRQHQQKVFVKKLKFQLSTSFAHAQKFRFPASSNSSAFYNTSYK
jgi:hypothetical protein